MPKAGKAGTARRPATGRTRLLLIGALAGIASPAVAQVPPPDPISVPISVPISAPVIAQAGLRDFDIAAQPLAAGLIEFARQSGLQVSAETGIIGSATTTGVRGRMTAAQALAALLSGTGLVYRLTGTMVVVEKAGAGSSSGAIQLDPVQVQGYPVPSQALIDNIPPPYAGGQVATGGQLGLLGNRDVMDSPFNQTSYTAKKAQDQQAKTVRDVLADDPSVRTWAPDGGVGPDQVRIRGFNVLAMSTSYGGLYGLLPAYSLMPELAERIEVLNGPSAMLNGMPPGGSIGGTINIVPKRAPDQPLAQVTANYASNTQFGGHVDLAHRFGADKQLGIRFNGVFRGGETAVQDNTDQRALAVLGLDFRGEHVRLSADAGYQNQYVTGVVPYLGLAAGVPLPWAPAARINQGQSWSNAERKDLFVAVRGEVDITEKVTAYAAFGAHDNRATYLASGGVTITGLDGNATAWQANFSEYYTYLTGEAGARALVDTGPIGHEFAFAATTLDQTYGTGFVQGTPFATNVYAPNDVARASIPTPAANKTGTSTLSGLALADTLSAADKRIQLTIGARLQQVSSANFNTTTGAQTSSYDQNALSPSVALVFKPWQHVSIYGNWIQGLQPGTVVGSTFANAGEVFPPYKSTQYEAGVKVDWGRLTTTASVFQITQPSILTNTAANTQYLGGEQRNQGLELNIFGEPVKGVRLLGGAMFLNAVLAKTQGGTTDGWIAPFSPGFNLNLAGEWDLSFVPGLTLNGRVVYTGSQYIDTTWPRRSLPDWTRFDLGARYVFENPGAKGKLLVARFNVENVLDANYWSGGNGVSTLFLGMPRTFRLSLTAEF
jgi:iron complex outermembrane recepter protein